MNHMFIALNKIVSHLITWGHPINKKVNEVILCISGNPGITDFYTEFGAELFEKTKIPVCVIGKVICFYTYIQINYFKGGMY